MRRHRLHVRDRLGRGAVDGLRGAHRGRVRRAPAHGGPQPGARGADPGMRMRGWAQRAAQHRYRVPRVFLLPLRWRRG